MSFLDAPKKVINKLENMCRNFLWGVIRKKELFEKWTGMEEGMFGQEKRGHGSGRFGCQKSSFIVEVMVAF